MATQSQPSREEERNGEIWSTRIQQELLALTTDNADLESTSENRSILPPFVAIQEHALDLMAGTCIVSVRVDIPPPKKTSQEEDEQEEGESRCVLVAMEASLKRNEDGTPNTKDASYPFEAPVARLTKGKDLFPGGLYH